MSAAPGTWAPAAFDAYERIAAFQRAIEDAERRRSARAQRDYLRAEPRRIKLFDGYRPHPKQFAAHRSLARFLSMFAGRRGGKTYAGARELLRRIYGRDGDLARKHRRGITWDAPRRITDRTVPLLHYWCIAPTYQQGLIQQRALQEALQRFPELVLKWVRNTLWLRGGALVEFRSADNPLSLVGEGLDGLWMDEAARVKESAWTDNARPTLSDKRGWAIFTSSPLGRNWAHDRLWVPALEGDPEYAGFHWTFADNPHNDPAELDEARRRLPKALFERNYLASFTAFEGQIYEHFSREVHVVGPGEVPFGRFVKVVGGQDWGHAHPGCALLAGIDRDGTWWFFRERHQPRLQVWLERGDCWGRWLLEQHNRRRMRKLWCGPDRPENIDLLHRQGLPADVAANSVHEGIETMSALMHVPEDGSPPSMRISSECKHLIVECETYRYATDPQGRTTERPLKELDDAADAARYATHSEFTAGGVPQLHFLRLVR